MWVRMALMIIVSPLRRHCEERSDEAIHISACGTMDCFASLAMTTPLPQMLRKIFRRPAPGELGALAVVHGHPLLIGEAMLSVIAVQLQRFAGGLHAFLEGVDHGRRTPVVLAREMRLQ